MCLLNCPPKHNLNNKNALKSKNCKFIIRIYCKVFSPNTELLSSLTTRESVKSAGFGSRPVEYIRGNQMKTETRL